MSEGKEKRSAINTNKFGNFAILDPGLSLCVEPVGGLEFFRLGRCAVLRRGVLAFQLVALSFVSLFLSAWLKTSFFSVLAFSGSIFQKVIEGAPPDPLRRPLRGPNTPFWGAPGGG